MNDRVLPAAIRDVHVLGLDLADLNLVLRRSNCEKSCEMHMMPFIRFLRIF